MKKTHSGPAEGADITRKPRTLRPIRAVKPEFFPRQPQSSRLSRDVRAFRGPIRKANLSDLPDLLQLEQLCFPSDRFSSRQHRYLITRAKAAVAVYERNGRVVASVVVLFRKNSRKAHLYNLSVHPHAQRQGIGQRLLQWAMRKARGEGCTQMVLEVKVRNRAAISLYKKFKFKPIQRLPKFYENGTDAYRMIASVSFRPLQLRAQNVKEALLS